MLERLAHNRYRDNKAYNIKNNTVKYCACGNKRQHSYVSSLSFTIPLYLCPACDSRLSIDIDRAVCINMSNHPAVSWGSSQSLCEEIEKVLKQHNYWGSQ